jgi:sulfite exporter TauE/SafE
VALVTLPVAYSVLGGVLTGLASSLHCAGMCGPIASGLLFAIAPRATTRERVGALFAAQAGKTTSYVLAGLALGGLGAAFAGYFDREIGFRIAQWGAAATLFWVGLSVAGLAPSLAGFDRLAGPLGSLLSRVQTRQSGHVREDAFLAGIFWGLFPCGMVYAALLNSLLAGSPWSGAMIMLGFGLGTMPAVTGAAFGILSLQMRRWNGTTRRIAGLSIVAIGVTGVLLTAPGGPLCISP